MNPDIAFFLLFFGVPLLFWTAASARALLRSLATRQWQPAPGRIISATPSHWRSFKNYLTVARVEYRYSVGAATYSSTEVGGGGDTSWSNSWPPAAGHAPGAEITAYYDPREPSRAVLRRGAGFNDWLAVLTPLIGLGFLIQWAWRAVVR